MKKNLLELMTENERYLTEKTLSLMDKFYDENAKLLGSESTYHDVRSSSYYAAGLLIRNQAGDLERACEIIKLIISLQYDNPEEIYHGTFRATPKDVHPPVGNLPWKSFSPNWTYFFDKTIEKVSIEFKKNVSVEKLDEINKIINLQKELENAVTSVLPVIWKSYDPNWREFIGCTFALILAEFEDMLPKDLVELIDESMKKAVIGSIERRVYDTNPMNCNVEFMHIFMTHYFGSRFSNKEWKEHAAREAHKCYKDFMEFKTLAEYNSPTYYGIDLFALGLWRKYLKSDSLKKLAEEIEAYLWEDIAQFYNPNLQNMCGPFARAYAMNMQNYVTTTAMFIILLTGPDNVPMPEITENSQAFAEFCYGPMISLIGANIPENIKASFLTYEQDRQIERKFREMIERGKPGERRVLCTATAYIEKDLMLGALSGSRNTSGQLHPLTVYWKSEDDETLNIRLIRREKNKHWSEHIWGILYDAKASQRNLSLNIDFNTEKEIELVFQIKGKNLNIDLITEYLWQLPGLNIELEANAPKPQIIKCKDFIEVIYEYIPTNSSYHTMNFNLNLTK